MRHNIIKTENYLLVVNNSEIVEADWAIHNSKNYRERFKEEPIKANKNNVLSIQEHWDKIIAHLPLNDAPYLDSVPVLSSLTHEDDVDSICIKDLQDFYGTDIHLTPKGEEYLSNFKTGYNKAKEKYNLTWEKLIDLYIEETGYGMDMWGKEENKTILTITKIIKFLQQPKLPVAFECETYRAPLECVSNGWDIDHRITVTNSEGRTEWVGKYIYE